MRHFVCIFPSSVGSNGSFRWRFWIIIPFNVISQPYLSYFSLFFAVANFNLFDFELRRSSQKCTSKGWRKIDWIWFVDSLVYNAIILLFQNGFAHVTNVGMHVIRKKQQQSPTDLKRQIQNLNKRFRRKSKPERKRWVKDEKLVKIADTLSACLFRIQRRFSWIICITF